jgi:hypothetical protein
MTAATTFADDPTLRIFRGAVDDYLARNRHAFPPAILSRNAQQAGIDALRNWWERHPGDGETHYDGHLAITDAGEKDRLKAAGWTCLGYSTFYFLAPPDSADGGP